jgi:hypothetical protein
MVAAADLPTGMVSDSLGFFLPHHVASTPHLSALVVDLLSPLISVAKIGGSTDIESEILIRVLHDK